MRYAKGQKRHEDRKVKLRDVWGGGAEVLDIKRTCDEKTVDVIKEYGVNKTGKKSWNIKKKKLKYETIKKG